MSLVTVRKAVASDAESIAAVHVKGWEETYAGLVPESMYGDVALQRRRDFWRAMFAEPHARTPTWVATSPSVTGEELIVGIARAGAAVTEPAPRATELYLIYVLAAHHGTGAGQALLDACLGDQPAFLWVAKGNPRARAFYERNGFRADGQEHIDADMPDLVELRMVR